ncbi:response regulator transcription factor, partial [Halobacterium salinarum]|nr:response regulator transcription factor [Halobacterium salinarum]
TSGAAALEAADDDVSVALLDRQMPTMTGDEVLAALRERALDIRVAMVTGIDPDFDIVEMPFDEYIQKPVDGDTLHDVVARLRTLNQYDDSIDELYRVTQKLATLEAQLSERKATLSEAADAALDAAGTSTDALGDEFARLF